MKSAWLALACCVMAAPAAAQSVNATAITAGPVQLKPDRGYILFRIDETLTQLPIVSPVLLRKPGPAEVALYDAAKKAAFEHDLPALTRRNAKQGITTPPKIEDYAFSFWGHPNLLRAWRKSGVALDKKVYAYLYEVEPTDFIVYGASISGNLDTCNCLGTIGFHVDPGVITDLGTFLMDDAEPLSAIPELASTTNAGKTYGNVVIATAIRPVTAATTIPSFIGDAPRKPAEFHAVGPFVEPGADSISRIAPMAGVLHYDKGLPVDDKTGQTLR